MNLKELIKRVKNLKSEIEIAGDSIDIIELQGIKQTVEAVDLEVFVYAVGKKQTFKDWHKLKKLLGMK